ncbi:DUF551 domain-containing protein [Massilia sp. CCM 8734]|uniref:DUF551 domain-containing protein n=1 Tax=Massilia sp. CCM 8734 TaxID=2609283 RepID=UPI00141F4C44|nr:DUF551 domain-containing protein [Massilia sp. CCM 8734]NHZ94600.1 DUF551 domain-containing protein [Massilia sp. CCM 8734]
MSAPVQDVPVGIVATYNRGGTGERNGIEPIGKAHCSLAEELEAGTLLYIAPVQQAAPSAWISVDDRLPEPGTSVLIFFPEDPAEPYRIDMWDEDADGPNAASWVVWYDSNITHWMPLPPAPTAAPAQPAGRVELPEAKLWMTHESRYRLQDGGNCKGAVPVHGKKSSTAKLPLFTEDQMRAALAQSADQDKLDAARYRALRGGKTIILHEGVYPKDGSIWASRYIHNPGCFPEVVSAGSGKAFDHAVDAAILAAKAGAA